MDSTLVFRSKVPSFGRRGRRVFIGLSYGLVGLFLNDTQAYTAPHSLRMSQGASTRAELLPDHLKISRKEKIVPRPTSLTTKTKRDGNSLSATPVPYEGLVSLSDFPRKKKTQKFPTQSPKIFQTSVPPSQKTGIDCETCKSQCMSPSPKSLGLTNLKIIQCIERAANPAIRRALLLSLRDQNMVLFSNLVTQYDLLNIDQ